MHVVLGGGGSASDEAAVLDCFASLVGVDGHVLYLPIAARDAETNPQRYVTWIESVLPPRGLRVAETWLSLCGHTPEQLYSFDGVVLGGGNTFELLHQLRMSGFADALAAFCKSGRTVYGGSAGAIVLGRDIASCASYDVDLRGMDDTRALDLCASSSVWCHFEARHEALLAEYIERSNETLIVLGKAAGALVTDDGVFGLGNGSAAIWSLERRALLPMASLVG